MWLRYVFNNVFVVDCIRPRNLSPKGACTQTRIQRRKTVRLSRVYSKSGQANQRQPISRRLPVYTGNLFHNAFCNVFVIFCTQAGQEESEVFWPQLCIVVNDNPEGQILAGIFDGATAEFPCRVCW